MKRFMSLVTALMLGVVVSRANHAKPDLLGQLTEAKTHNLYGQTIQDKHPSRLNLRHGNTTQIQENLEEVMSSEGITSKSPSQDLKEIKTLPGSKLTSSKSGWGFLKGSEKKSDSDFSSTSPENKDELAETVYRMRKAQLKYDGRFNWERMPI